MRRLTLFGFAVIAALGLSVPSFARVADSSAIAAVQRASPAVVSISIWKAAPPDHPGGEPGRLKVYGSGFVVDPKGIIVTNKHVVDGALDIKVVLADGTVLPATLVDASPLVDLAVVQVNADHPLPSLDWGDSEALQVGQSVLTIGNGLDWSSSVSAGIVSALNRNLMDSPFDRYIQTDATINHGNSGGPLIDLDGKVVGVTTALFNPSATGGFIGIGFAIPASTVQFVIKHLLDPKLPDIGWLGFSLQDMTETLAEALSVPQATGAIVASVDGGGPAANAGLRPGDILIRLNGKDLGDGRAYMRAVAESPTGQPVRLTVWRLGKAQDVSVTVQPWPDSAPRNRMMTGQMAAAMMAAPPHAGMKLAALTDADRKQYKLDPAIKGVLVTDVETNSEAGNDGVVAGNVILQVENVPVTSPDDVTRVIAQAHADHRSYLAVLVQMTNGAQWLSFSVSTTKS